MVFEVLGTTEAPRLLNDGTRPASPPVPSTPVSSPVSSPPVPPTSTAPAPPTSTAPALPTGVIQQLLRSAVTLQAEGLLRTAGALAGVWGDVIDRIGWIERDARDLAALTAAATDADVRLPAGIDSGAGDPAHPSSVVEGLLAGHEALVEVLRRLASAAGGDVTGSPWAPVVEGILARREEEILFLRAVGAEGRLPADEAYVHGSPTWG